MMAYFENIGTASAHQFLKTKCRNYQPKKAAIFSRNDVCKFLLDQEWILQKVVLMMGIFGGCRCDELSKIMNCYSFRIPPPPGGTAILSEYIHYYGYYYQVIVQCLST
jgi:hypothetical protein